MKKYLPYIVIALVLIGGVGAYVITNKGDDTKSESTGSSKTADASDNAAKKYSDACTLFTREDIGAALGGTYGEGEEEYEPSTASPGSDNYDDLQGSGCSFDQDNDGSTAGMTAALDLAIAVKTFATTEDASSFMNDLQNPQTAEAQEAVSEPVVVDGIGDQAFFPRVNVANSIAEKTEALYVRFGRQIIVLTATRLDGVDRPTVQTGLTALAKKL
ncbi:hypothetical protein E6P97_02775 [Patescibacteria group bacterium]|nr:MAG: hypothetical protein E6P97_02775 [Patescibacteria group bacterium]